MSSREFAEWMAYMQVEPFGEQRMDYRFGILGAALGNIMIKLWSGKEGRLKPADFIPEVEGELEEVDVAAKIEQYFGGMAGAKDT